MLRLWLVATAVMVALFAFVSACSSSGDSTRIDPGGAASPSGGGSLGGGGSGANGGAGGSGGTASGAPHLPCDVDAVLARSCRSCHGATTAYGAPNSLVTYADLTAPSKIHPDKKTYELVLSRIHDDASPMPPGPNPRLSAADSSVIDAWVAAGAPSSNAACGGGSDGAGTGASGGDPDPLKCTADTHIVPQTPFAVDATAVDQYVCYGFDVTPAKKRHVIGLAPHIDNKAVVHHLLLFQSDTSYGSTPQPCAAFGSTQWRLVSGWAPGGKNLYTPPEAGFPEEGTTHWILQVHYNNAKGLTGQKDASGYDLCTTDQLRANDAEVLAFGSVNFSIPPHSTLNLSCDYTFGAANIHVFGASPHMHLRGRAMSSINTSAKGGPSTIVDQPHFDFQSQVGFDANQEIATGDVIRTKCVWANDTDNAIKFGETTNDEMCFDFISYYPKVTTPFWSWTTPSILANCTSQ